MNAAESDTAKPRTATATGAAQRQSEELPQDEAGATTHLLVVEDEQDVLEMLRYNLVRHGFRVTCADNGEEALRKIGQEVPDLVVLDLMLPGMDGLELCRVLKARSDTQHISVVMLTAKSEESDVVSGLEIGADDYVAKPFSIRLLVARIRAVLRRKLGRDADGEEPVDAIQLDSLTVDPTRHEAKLDGETLQLTPTEFRLLTLLASRPGRVFSRPQIIEAIHGQHVAVTDRSVDVQVLHLRRKLQHAGSKIEAVRGVGYRFRDD